MGVAPPFQPATPDHIFRARLLCIKREAVPGAWESSPRLSPRKTAEPERRHGQRYDQSLKGKPCLRPSASTFSPGRVRTKEKTCSRNLICRTVGISAEPHNSHPSWRLAGLRATASRRAWPVIARVPRDHDTAPNSTPHHHINTSSLDLPASSFRRQFASASP